MCALCHAHTCKDANAVHGRSGFGEAAEQVRLANKAKEEAAKAAAKKREAAKIQAQVLPAACAALPRRANTCGGW